MHAVKVKDTQRTFGYVPHVPVPFQRRGPLLHEAHVGLEEVACRLLRQEDVVALLNGCVCEMACQCVCGIRLRKGSSKGMDEWVYGIWKGSSRGMNQRVYEPTDKTDLDRDLLQEVPAQLREARRGLCVCAGDMSAPHLRCVHK